MRDDLEPIERELIRLHVNPVYTKIDLTDVGSESLSRLILQDVGEVIRARPEGFQFSPKYRDGRWNGYINLLKGVNFPTGLLEHVLPRLKEIAKELALELLINRYTLPPVEEAVPETLHDVILRNYQVDAINDLLQAGRGVAHIATGGGKTLIIAALIYLIQGSALVITHKKELLHQTSHVIKQHTGLDVGLVGDGLSETDRLVTVAMIQTLYKQSRTTMIKDLLKRQTCLIIDEVHHVSSRTMYEVVMKIPARWRYGVSGTPLRYVVLDDMQLMAATGGVVVTITNDELIKAGYNALPVIHLYHIYNPAESNGDYQAHYENMIVSNPTRNGIVATQSLSAYKRGNVVLVLVDRLDHQNIIYNQITIQQKKNVYRLNGSQESGYRNKMLDLMRTGKPGIFIATEILGEGVDVPALGMVILAGGGKSHIRLLQRVGRGMRPKEDEINQVDVVDFIDHGSRYLEQHSKERMRIYDQEGFLLKEN